MPHERYARLPEVLVLTGLSKPHIYRMMAEGNFPGSYKLAERAVGWKLSEIEDWLASREKTFAA